MCICNTTDRVIRCIKHEIRRQLIIILIFSFKKAGQISKKLSG